jgi:glutaredoxin
MKHLTLLLIIFFSTLPASQAEEVYKWVDENGKLHFGDKKPKDQKIEKVNLKVINSITNVSYENSTFNAGKKVIIYTASWCGYCKKAKQYFKANNIPYTEMDIEKSRLAKSQFKRFGGKGVPIILVGDKRMRGFSEAGFERIYN